MAVTPHSRPENEQSPPHAASAAPAPDARAGTVQHGPKWIALGFWLLLLGGYVWYTYANQLSPLQAVRQLIDVMQQSAYGPLIFILVYALRPLIFFSAALLTIAGGFLFGPVWGVVLTVIAANTSAMVAYVIGHYFGRGLLRAEAESQGLMQRYAARLRANSFETVLIMRFLFLPYDLVNYLAGFLRVDWKAFLLATIIGSIPGTISFVLFGASIESFDGGVPRVNPWVLGAGFALFLVSLGLSRYFKRREQTDPDNA